MKSGKGKIEQILFLYDLYDIKIVKLIALEFEEYVLFWRNQFQKMLKRGRNNPSKLEVN